MAPRLPNGSYVLFKANPTGSRNGGPLFGSGDLRRTKATEFNLGADLEWKTNERWRNRFVATYYRRDLDRDSPGVSPLVPPSIEDTSYWHLRSGWLRPPA